MAKVVISGITPKDKEDIFLDLLVVSRERLLTRFENFLFTLLYADKIKCETELTKGGNLLEIINADYSKSLSVSQKFMYDILLQGSGKETIRFDKQGKPKQNHNTNMY